MRRLQSFETKLNNILHKEQQISTIQLAKNLLDSLRLLNMLSCLNIFQYEC